MKQNVWQAIIGLSLIAAFFSVVALVAYALYGPGVAVVVPDRVRNFGLETTTTIQNIAKPENPEPAHDPSGSGAVASPSSAPTSAEVLADQPGAFFGCSNQKALKAEFLEERVRLALSDGRSVTLPQVVGEEGEVLYANANQSFVFRNVEDVVFLEENGTVAYEDCTVE